VGEAMTVSGVIKTHAKAIEIKWVIILGFLGEGFIMTLIFHYEKWNWAIHQKEG
jgi:hypothetical protein